MVIARSVSETFPYVCLSDRELPKQQQTVFRLRRLPALLALSLDNLHDASADGTRVTLRMGDQRKVILLAGIAGWENLTDSAGAPVEFKSAVGDRSVCGLPVKNPAREDLVDLLPQEIAEELVSAIRDGNTFTESDAKN